MDVDARRHVKSHRQSNRQRLDKLGRKGRDAVKSYMGEGRMKRERERVKVRKRETLRKRVRDRQRER